MGIVQWRGNQQLAVGGGVFIHPSPLPSSWIPNLVVEDLFTDTDGTGPTHVIAPTNTIGASWSAWGPNASTIVSNTMRVGGTLNSPQRSGWYFAVAVTRYQIKLLATRLTSGAIFPGVVLRYVNNTNFLFCTVNNAGSLILQYVEAGVNTNINSTTGVPSTLGVAYELTVTVVADDFTLAWQAQSGGTIYTLTGNSSKFSANPVAGISEQRNSVVAFDDFRLYT